MKIFIHQASQGSASCCHYPLCNSFPSMMKKLIIYLFFMLRFLVFSCYILKGSCSSRKPDVKAKFLQLCWFLFCVCVCLYGTNFMVYGKLSFYSHKRRNNKKFVEVIFTENFYEDNKVVIQTL